MRTPALSSTVIEDAAPASPSSHVADSRHIVAGRRTVMSCVQADFW
jgi:hypothetical protein